MEIVDITPNDQEMIKDYISPDVLEYLSRENCFGLMVSQDSDSMCGALVYEWRDRESEHGIRAELLDFFAETKEAGTLLMERYFEHTKKDGVSKTWFEFEKLSETERSVLEKAGFLLTEEESRDIVIQVKDLKKLSKLIAKKPPKHIKMLKDIIWIDMYQG